MASNQTTVTSNGRVTIPVEIRRELNLSAGERLIVERKGNTVILRRAISVAERTAGIFADYRLETPLTPEQERAAFEQAVADEVARSLEEE